MRSPIGFFTRFLRARPVRRVRVGAPLTAPAHAPMLRCFITTSAISVSAALCSPAAQAFGIDRLALELDAAPGFSAVDSLTVFNDSNDEAVFVKAQALKWDADLQGRFLTEPSSDLRILPSVQRVRPGDRGVFHVRYAGAPLKGEGSYRVLFQEVRIPVGQLDAKPEEIDNTIRQGFSVGLAMSVPVYVADRSKPSDSLARLRLRAQPAAGTDGAWLLRVDNPGDRHVSLQRLRIDGVVHERPLGVVLAAREREFRLESPLPAGSTPRKLEVQAVVDKDSRWVEVALP